MTFQSLQSPLAHFPKQEVDFCVLCPSVAEAPQTSPPICEEKPAASDESEASEGEEAQAHAADEAGSAPGKRKRKRKRKKNKKKKMTETSVVDDK